MSQPIRCGGCGSNMELHPGTETRLMLRCSNCDEYFYAASRGMVAVGGVGVLREDWERALDLVLSEGEGWEPTPEYQEALRRIESMS